MHDLLVSLIMVPSWVMRGVLLRYFTQISDLHYLSFSRFQYCCLPHVVNADQRLARGHPDNTFGRLPHPQGIPQSHCGCPSDCEDVWKCVWHPSLIQAPLNETIDIIGAIVDMKIPQECSSDKLQPHKWCNYLPTWRNAHVFVLLRYI